MDKFLSIAQHQIENHKATLDDLDELEEMMDDMVQRTENAEVSMDMAQYHHGNNANPRSRSRLGLLIYRAI
jgi:hypothetical protein